MDIVGTKVGKAEILTFISLWFRSDNDYNRKNYAIFSTRSWLGRFTKALTAISIKFLLVISMLIQPLRVMRIKDKISQGEFS